SRLHAAALREKLEPPRQPRCVRVGVAAARPESRSATLARRRSRPFCGNGAGTTCARQPSGRMSSMGARTAESPPRFSRHVGTVYPTEHKVGEDLLQRLIVELLRPLVERWLASRGTPSLTGADQFIYFRRGDVRGRVAPDVFVLPGVRPGRRVRSWKTWEE